MPGILITGGARSGKSSFAGAIATKSGEPVLFVATAEPLDAEMAKRIAAHRQARPSTWITLEAPRRVGNEIGRHASGERVIIIDCITLLMNNVFNEFANISDDELDSKKIEKECLAEIEAIITSMRELDASFIIVTNEVGEGLVPLTGTGRLYRDILGKANQILAAECDTVYLMVSGIPLQVKPDRKCALQP